MYTTIFIYYFDSSNPIHDHLKDKITVASYKLSINFTAQNLDSSVIL